MSFLLYRLSPATEDHIASVQVYPNPVSDFIQIDGLVVELKPVLIYSAQGEHY